MEIIKGKIAGPQKIVLYGPEGIGKSTFASHFPDPLFIDTESSTINLDVSRLPVPDSWEQLQQQVEYIRDNPGICKTLVVDSLDWAERLCIQYVCKRAQKANIEDFGFGKGYTYVCEEFQKLLGILKEIIRKGITVLCTAHAAIRKFDQPDEMGSYDRWEMKLTKAVSPLVKEWADAVLFANYRIITVQTKEKKTKAQGGTRVLFTTHNPCWDAKNRWGMPEEMEFSYSAVAPYIPSNAAPVPTREEEISVNDLLPEPITSQPAAQQYPSYIPKALADLMAANQVSEEELKEAVAQKGYYPADISFEKYDPKFVNGSLIRAWPKVLKIILENRELPFEMEEENNG